MDNNSKEFLYNLISITAGIAVGYLINGYRRWRTIKRPINHKIILHQLQKKIMQNNNKIQKEWIEPSPTELDRYGIKTKVYYGGFARKELNQPELDKLKQYEFIVDAYTGTLIDIYEL